MLWFNAGVGYTSMAAGPKMPIGLRLFGYSSSMFVSTTGPLFGVSGFWVQV
jgi:hypothetical protein